ncbi:MAG TPA: hypothetical protein VF062_15085 [Candidatus Limnocylindrales bacterium]
MRRFTVIVLLAAATLLPASAVNAAEAVVSGNLEALFTAPTVAGAADATVHASIVSLVDGAAAGSTIWVALGTDVDPSIADRLLAAQNERSVTVLAVAEQCPSGTGATCAAPSATLTGLSSGLAPGRFVWCSEGCVGAFARNSFLVLDALADGRTDVVAQASGDLSVPARVQRHNLLVSSTDPALAAGYRSYFGQLAANTNATFTGGVSGAGGKTEVFFHPRAGTEDVVAGAINDVQCPGGSIRMAASTFAAARSAVVNALIAKRTAGCSVSIIMQDRNDALPALGAGAMSVVTYRPGGCRMPVSGSCTTGGMGSSYVLIEGVSAKAGGVAKKFVWTGTGRYTAVKDDATVVKIDDATIYAGYLADWTQAYNTAIVLQPSQWPYAEITTGNGTASGDQDLAQMAAGRNGHLAVVWEDDRSGTDPEDNIHSEIYIRMFQNGVSKYEKKISAGGTGNWKHVRPDVAVDNSGNAVVTWLHDADGNGVYNIYASYLNASGTITGTVRVNADADGQQMYPAVAIDPDGGAGGGFVVVWEDRRTSPSHVRAAGFASIGTKRYEVQVSATTKATGANALPDVGVDSAANAYIVWQEDKDGNDYYQIALRVLTPGGGNKVSQKAANSEGDLQQADPSIAVNANGDFVVAWRGDQTGALRAYFRTFNSATTALIADRRAIADTEATGEPLGTQTEPKAGIDDQGNVVIAWMEAGYAGSEPWARGFSRTGNPAGKFPPARMSVFTTNKQADISLAVHPYGEFSVGYTDDRDGNGHDQIQLRNFFSNALW